MEALENRITGHRNKELDKYLDGLEDQRSGIFRNKADKIYHSALHRVENLISTVEKLQELED